MRLPTSNSSWSCGPRVLRLALCGCAHGAQNGCADAPPAAGSAGVDHRPSRDVSRHSLTELTGSSWLCSAPSACSFGSPAVPAADPVVGPADSP